MTETQSQMQPAIVYNLVDTLIHPFSIPSEYPDIRLRLGSYQEYDMKSTDLLRTGEIGVKPIVGAAELLQRVHEKGYRNALYSHSSEERLKLVLQILGWSQLVDANYGTLDRPEICDKEKPISYENLQRIMRAEGLDPKFYVTTKREEAGAARYTLEVILITGFRETPSLRNVVSEI